MFTSLPKGCWQEGNGSIQRCNKSRRANTVKKLKTQKEKGKANYNLFVQPRI